MTCIAGIVDGDKIWMGGDSAGVDSSAYSLTVRADQKVFRNGEMVFGFCGSFRIGQVLRYALVPPKHPRRIDIHRYMVTDFVDAVRDTLKKAGVNKKLNEVEEMEDASFLVGYRGRLFEIEQDYQVGEAVDGFSAIGCGCRIAQGALYVTQTMEPRKRIRMALEAAERYSGGVRRPFYVMKIGGEE